ncbi:hypothetical protein MSG28_016128 [Choristoneura fumiferana]|uniref:Uncharacterized protein n=1 Tax=Choristoneura fumiferana TaxID=7141 RepID=A0ACC0K5K3_CHOFU|nr:hypothetical protein MSG28_016128 [Choristoneura fumiferana]
MTVVLIPAPPPNFVVTPIHAPDLHRLGQLTRRPAPHIWEGCNSEFYMIWRRGWDGMLTVFFTEMPSRFRQSLPHECDACRLRFRSRLKLLKHRQSHRAVYTCNECGYASRFRTYVKNHWLMHKGTTYTCPYCQIVYNHQTSYYNHIRIQHPGENEACYECGETFAAGRGMNLHKALAHRTSDKSNAKHKCKDCGVKFLNAEALQRHEELGAGVPHAALWPCAACGDSCGSDTALKAHAAEQHTDRHHCDECNKTFLNSESFELHVQRKHMNKRAVEGPFRPRVGVGRRQPCVYVCEICGKVFKVVGPCGRSARITTTILLTNPAVKQQCLHCCVSTWRVRQPNSTLLQYHMNGHLAVKPFQCKQCPKTFPRQGALNLRNPISGVCICGCTQGERPYQCEQCPQAFASPSNLSRHTKYRHTKYRELVKCNICGKLLRAVSLSLHVRTVHQNLRYERKRNPKGRELLPSRDV